MEADGKAKFEEVLASLAEGSNNILLVRVCAPVMRNFDRPRVFIHNSRQTCRHIDDIDEYKSYQE